ncbi:hypothetical protein PASE110613_09370 [Paenibacillus sediminis]|uniref:PD(D/E)XK endonuclease domain-containing protein n=1 Tax=Paenibacillus sediminis TaxID=664909 RepID=A0ABS4H704_9BACL|nr:hypothetical protein [Paenibacillus sediminis]MBP1938142.1 hypothetical protein [Paenibacillus sediminis]
MSLRKRRAIDTAHVSEITGKYSELIARAALLANGWTVHRAETDESYDILATDPVSGDHVKVQVKTIRQREDRGGDLVVYAKKGNGTAYDRADADYIVGVWAADGEVPRVYMFENRLLTEYWCAEARAAERWVELPIAFNRALFTELPEVA